MTGSARPAIVIVTPALADANNGNWQTARRWASMLSGLFDVRLAARWQPADEWSGQPCGKPPGKPADLMIALHARRSAASIAAWRQARPRGALIVVLTGTDLYRDIASDADALRSLHLADRLIVLNELGVRSLPAELRGKARVCLQSSPSHRARGDKTGRHLRVLMVGHLRAEKDPLTYFDAVSRLAGRHDLLFDHIGGALDPALGDAARALGERNPRYRWLGPLAHRATRARIADAHLLVHPSRMEGGAHVVIEAITSATPVLASRIDGNLGLLGEDYRGSFAPGDGAALARLIERCRDEPAMLAALEEQCRARAALFHPDRERATLRAIVDDLLETTR